MSFEMLHAALPGIWTGVMTIPTVRDGRETLPGRTSLNFSAFSVEDSSNFNTMTNVKAVHAHNIVSLVSLLFELALQGVVCFISKTYKLLREKQLISIKQGHVILFCCGDMRRSL